MKNSFIISYLLFVLTFPCLGFGQVQSGVQKKQAGNKSKNTLTLFNNTSLCKPGKKVLRLYPEKGSRVIVGFASDSVHSMLFGLKVPATAEDTIRISLTEKCNFNYLTNENGQNRVLKEGWLILIVKDSNHIQLTANYQYQEPGKKKAL